MTYDIKISTSSRKRGGLKFMTICILFFPDISKRAHINETQYLEEYNKSVTDPDRYWSDIANKFITWDQPWTTVSDVNFDTAEIKWFLDAKLNVSKNCLDRHLEKNGEKIAIMGG